MGVDQTSLDRIRNARFTSSRRGYDKREVDKFLARLADWLETGGGDDSRSDTVKRELERVGQRTGAILSQAEESAQQIRGEAEAEAREIVVEANATAEKARSEADGARAEADAYAEQARSSADNEAQAHLSEANRNAAETIEEAQAQAARIVEEGAGRRRDVESVIADLVARRDAVLADIEKLGSKLEAAISEHRPSSGADPNAEPEEHDPESAERRSEDDSGGEEAELNDDDVDSPVEA